MKHNLAEITCTVNGCSFEMIGIEGGTFQMGGTPEQGAEVMDDELPVHTVTLDNYYLGKFVVTKALWVAVMGEGAYCRKMVDPTVEPADDIEWSNTQFFIQELNRLTGRTFTLPTEAQWEYAARGGRKSCGYKYAGSDHLDEVGWYDKNAEGTVHPVGLKKPNELGLYDMSGNVWEWCQDRLEPYDSSTGSWLMDPDKGERRVLRGGSYLYIARYCRNSCRYDLSPNKSHHCIGFRIALLP